VIVEVEKIDQLKLGAKLIAPEIHLDTSAGIFDVTEHDLTLRPPGLDPPRYRDLRPVLTHIVAVGSQRLRTQVTALVTVGERLNP
jgi:hypothetical protein